MSINTSVQEHQDVILLCKILQLSNKELLFKYPTITACVDGRESKINGSDTIERQFADGPKNIVSRHIEFYKMINGLVTQSNMRLTIFVMSIIYLLDHIKL